MQMIFTATLWAALFLGGSTLFAAEASFSSLPLDKATVGWGTPTPNRSIEGKPLTVKGTVYEKGLGLHSPGMLSVKIDGQPERFTCSAAIDDETDGKGCVEVRFYGNGWKLLHTTGVIRGGLTDSEQGHEFLREPLIVRRLALVAP